LKNAGGSSVSRIASASRPKSALLPARWRASSSVVSTVMSARADSAQASSVRTLWPASSPMSQSTPTSRSMRAASCGDGSCASRISTSTSDEGKSSPRP
jgi:hypothetical protein